MTAPGLTPYATTGQHEIATAADLLAVLERKCGPLTHVVISWMGDHARTQVHVHELTHAAFDILAEFVDADTAVFQRDGDPYLSGRGEFGGVTVDLYSQTLVECRFCDDWAYETDSEHGPLCEAHQEAVESTRGGAA